ncbi:pbf1, partial [Coccomyxa viridis]
WKALLYFTLFFYGACFLALQDIRYTLALARPQRNCGTLLRNTKT